MSSELHLIQSRWCSGDCDPIVCDVGESPVEDRSCFVWFLALGFYLSQIGVKVVANEIGSNHIVVMHEAGVRRFVLRS